VLNGPIGEDDVKFPVNKRKGNAVCNVGLIQILVGQNHGVDIYADEAADFTAESPKGWFWCWPGAYVEHFRARETGF